MMESTIQSKVGEVRYTSFGSTFIGSLLSFFSKKLMQQAPPEQPLYFLAREGYWLEKMYQTYLKGAGLKRDSFYLLVSRAFLFKIMMDDERSYRHSLKSDFNSSFYHLMRTRFLLSDQEIKSIFDQESYELEVSLP
ncbi:hypothetical protein [Marinomonas sp. GJ51-6]|uniref:hypothetical protein n=1 Tax=Marinomonas sp. GJ51-6 TaxID=2992802 RepID=UPI0029352130|nr:hypothetical protein [Marinomonas sp. GJ51-6]WOD06154.1 hypothetical protein ONZ50_10425 [Marinomonas sp. GJ51-6]